MIWGVLKEERLMGPFISLSGVFGANQEEVEQAIRVFAVERGGQFEIATDLYDICSSERSRIAAAGDRVSFLHPDFFLEGEAVSMRLSVELRCAVFSFDIYNNTSWTITLFVDGAEVTRFDPRQAALSEIPENERQAWGRDSAAICAQVLGLPLASIERYFLPWSEDLILNVNKAYPDDESPYGNNWQMVDLMKRLGFVYPNEMDPSVSAEYRLQLPQPAPQRQESWWDLWLWKLRLMRHDAAINLKRWRKR
jgi:hypothetical protein